MPGITPGSTNGIVYLFLQYEQSRIMHNGKAEKPLQLAAAGQITGDDFHLFL